MKILTIALCALWSLLGAQKTAPEVLESMHRKYYHKVCRSYTFSQKNKHYHRDSLIGNSVWHEAVEFPDKFSIMFGDTVKGNHVVFRNDSVYHYRKAGLAKAERDSNNLLLLLGGMFYRELPDVKVRLAKAGYDLSQFSENKWMGKTVYVLGSTGNLQTNQVWVDRSSLRVMRIIEKINEKDWMDMRFEEHKAWCDGYVETKVSFRRNGELEQEEEYFNLRVISEQ